MRRHPPNGRVTCPICQRDPLQVNSAVSECSHIDCPSRPRCWSDGTQPAPRQAQQASPLADFFEAVED